MKYYWDSINLRQDLRIIKRALEKEQDQKRKIHLYDAIYDLRNAIIMEEISKSNDEENNSRRNILELCSTAPSFNELYPFFEEFKRKLASTYSIKTLSNLRTTVKNEKIEPKMLSENDMIELINEFFKTMGKEIYDMYTKLYQDRFTRIRFSSELEKSYMYFVPYLNKSYVQIGESRRYPCESKLISLAHEEGHCIGALMNPHGYIEGQRQFREIESLFFQMIACKFFGQELNTSFFDKKLAEMLEIYYFEADEILELRKIAEIFFGTLSPNSEDFEITDISLRMTIEDVLNNPTELPNQIKYGFSYIVAIELFELYQEDKEEALRKLREIITSDNEYEQISIIETVTPNKSLIKHKKRVIG